MDAELHSAFRLAAIVSLRQPSLVSGVVVSEDAAVGDLLVIEYSVKPVGALCSVFMQDPTSTLVYNREARIETDDETVRAVHTANREGEHRVCFANREGRQQLTIDVQYKVGGPTRAAANDVAKKEALKPMESKLAQLETTVTQISTEMRALQGQEAEMTAVRDSTASRIVWFSVTTTLLLLGLKAAEILYLRQYFKARRLIQ